VTLLALRVALDPTPAQERALRSHAGAARVAFNWGLGRVKANLSQREAKASYAPGRGRTVLAVGARTDRPDYEYADGVVLHLYELTDGHRSVTRVPALGGGSGASFTVTRAGRRLVVEALGTHRPWSAHVSGGRLVHAAPGTLRLGIEL